MRAIILLFTHAAALGAGFALGVYLLPILTAPAGPDEAELAAAEGAATLSGTFTRDLEGSDLVHWGEGTVSVGPDRIAHRGALSPGPDYKLYLTTEFVETEAAFLAIKDQAAYVGDVKTFDGFALDVPAGVDVEAYGVVVIWCEAFSEFITAARYR